MVELSKNQLDDADFGLAQESLLELNNDFYSLEPWVYFHYRLRNLALSAGRGLELQNMVAEGIAVGDFKVGAESYEAEDALTADERRDQQAFVILETEVLLHHAAETLLRLYLAHAGSPDCPWLSMARERSFRRFKKKVADLLDNLSSPQGRDEMSEVFFGTLDRKTLNPVPDEDKWNSLVENAADWLSWFGKYILDGNVYNAAKHGLGVRPQNSALRVEIDGLADFLNGSGPCLEYLHTGRNSEGRNQWRRTTKWIKLDRSFGCIHVASVLIHRLWAVASVRHGNRASFELELMTFPSPSEMIGNDEMALATFSRTLRYHEDASAES